MDSIIRPVSISSNLPIPHHDDDDGMQCTSHPYRTNSSPGGICALCLQEKLGKLVSSTSLFNPAPTSPPPLRSDLSASSSSASALSLRPSSTKSTSKRPKIIPFLKKKKITAETPSNFVLKRSRSAAAPRRNPSGFWSFLYQSKPKQDRSSSSVSASSDLKPPPPIPPIPAISKKAAEYIVVVDESADSPNSAASSNATSFGRKVSRSRSVGCGSRSFSGDFFERISTGLGDCALRRVESQREGKPRNSASDGIKERPRCGGIFSGFTVTSSSTSYWLPEDPNQHHAGGRVDVHARSRSWGWALASPMRAFRKPPSPKASGKSNATPNLAAIPSLLSVRG